MSTSQGLVTTSRIAWEAYLTTCGTMERKTAMFLRVRSMRVSPGFWFAPAVRMTMSAFSQSA